MAKKANKPGTAKPVHPADFEARLLEASASDALGLLEEVGDKAVDLVEAWIRGGNAATVSAVAQSEVAPALARKAARRGLNVLRSRGISIPEKKASLELSNSVSYEAWFLPADQNGVSIVLVGSSSAGANRQIVQVQIQQEAGVVELSGGEITGSAFRENFQRIQAVRRMRPAPVPVDWARWYIARARERNAVSGVVVPLGFDASASLVGPVPTSAPIHPVDAAKLEVADADIDNRAKESSKLHNYPEFVDWLPDFNFVQDMLVRVGQRIGANPQQEPEKVNGLIQEEVVSATDRFFTPELRAKVAGRMKDSTISVLSRAGTEAAIDVLATAEAVRRAGLITSPPSEIPFLKDFFNKALSVLASQNNGQISIPTPPPAVGGNQPVVAPPEALEAAARTARGESE
jgi:hypothetical protein